MIRSLHGCQKQYVNVSLHDCQLWVDRDRDYHPQSTRSQPARSRAKTTKLWQAEDEIIVFTS